MLKTLKVSKYRGCHSYVRHIMARQYEVLISYRGQVYQNGLVLPKHSDDKRLSAKEIEDAAIDQGLRCAIQLIDNLIEERSFKNLIKTLITTLHAKTITIINRYYGECASISRKGEQA